MTGERSLLARVRPAAIGLLIVAALAQCVLFVLLPFSGYDGPFHLFHITELHQLASTSGLWLPHWLPDAFRGFGSPALTFYAPLSYLITTACYGLFAGLSAAAIAKLAGLVTLALSGVTMAQYLRRGLRLDLRASALGALLYMAAPYRYFDLSTRAAFSEHVAFLFLPLVLLGAEWMLREEELGVRHARTQRAMGTLLYTLSFALMAITSLPATVTVSLGLLMMLLTRSRVIAGMLRLGGATLLATLLAAFYIMPAFALSHDVQLERLWTLPTVIQCSPFLGLFWGQDLVTSSYNLLGFVGIVVAFVALGRGHGRQERAWRWMLLVVIILFMPYISQWLFYGVPPFTVIQRAERLTMLGVFVVSALWARELAGEGVDRSRPWASMIVVLWAVGSLAMLGVQLSGKHINVRKPLAIEEAAEYATRWMKPYDDHGISLEAGFASDTSTAFWEAPMSEVTLSRTALTDTVRYTSSVEQRITLRRAYWPTWVATVDGVVTPALPDSLGRLTATLPAGEHLFALHFEEASATRWGRWLSLIGLVLTVVLAIEQGRRVRASR